MRKILISLMLLTAGSGFIFAEGTEVNIDLHLSHLIFQVILILIAGKIGGDLAAKIQLPRPLGQLVLGIIISPHFLGGTFMPLFNDMLFPLNEISHEIPVSNEIYLLSSLAFVILLFMTGLETNISLFLRYFVKGSVIGFTEVLIAFFGTLAFTSWYFDVSMASPLALFVATFIAPTSVAIMAEVLFRSRKLGSPEGVIIITSAVLDDILSIVLLSVVMGLVTLSGTGGAITPLSISWVVIRAVLILVAFGAISLAWSKKMAKVIKGISSYDNSYIAVLALIVAFIASIFMQMVGLSYIVGAYITGLAFSNTDMKFMLRDKLHTIESLFVPLFFVVMGMFVDINVLLDPETLLLGFIFSLLAMGLKVIGNGIPAYFMGFNLMGASRIGFGMVSRGELTLIIASTALGLNFISPQIFAVAVAVTFIPSLLASPVIVGLFKSNARGTREAQTSNDKELFYRFPSGELAKLVCWELQAEYEEEGYYVYQSKTKGKSIFQVRKDSTFFTFTREYNRLTFSVSEDDILLIKTFLYEVLLKLTNDLSKVKGLFDQSEMAKAIEERSSMTNRAFRGALKLFKKERIIFLRGNTKEDAIKELVDALPAGINHNEIYEAVFEREKQYTTGMPGGLALPHAKVEGLEKTEVVIGISPKGLDFEAMDKGLSHVFVLIASPKDGYSSHLEIMAQLSGFLNPNKVIYQDLIHLKNSSEVLVYLKSLKNEDASSEEEKENPESTDVDHDEEEGESEQK